MTGLQVWIHYTCPTGHEWNGEREWVPMGAVASMNPNDKCPECGRAPASFTTVSAGQGPSNADVHIGS